ncbi:hypothetical protein B7R74_15985 [Yersinia pseudotuberculosis]|nr:hypothetical protein B7R74_15985 [Yersinia pseudotuberculosis]
MATLNDPNDLLVLILKKQVSSSGLMRLIPEAHPTGSINTVQIGSRPICISLAAFLQLELIWV